jgi:hypothetical protein
MKIDLAVIGQGAVSPAGVGLEALLQHEPVPTPCSSLRHPDKPWPVLRVDLKNPAFARWQKEPRLRRASPITFYLVEAAEQGLTGLTPADRAETGLIVAFSAGCLAYSRRFFEGIITGGQRTASPALFPETVFNSPVSHVAAVLGLNGAAYALVGDETAWIAALKTASVWLRQQRVRQVLVLGAEEFDPIVLDAYRHAHWLSRQNPTHTFLASEGAAGLLVRSARTEDALRITHAHDGLIYRSKKEAVAAAARLFHGIDPAIPSYPSAQRNWLGSQEKKATENRPIVPVTGQPYLGEAFTASSAWHTVRALHHLTSRVPRIFLPIWGLNHQLGSLALERAEKPSS